MELNDGYAQSALGLIPRDWSCKPLADFLSFISYGFTNPMPTVSDGVYMITAADIDQGKLQLASARKTSIASFQKLLTAKSKPRTNDILLTKDGSLGRLALVGDEVICINQSVAVLRPNEKVEPNFLKLLLESPWYQTRMLDDAGGSTIKHIYITIVDKMPIGLPLDKKEQRAIATALSDVDALIAGLEKLIAKKRDLKQAAMQQLLTGQTRLPGFSGEWVVKALGDIADLYQPKTISQTSFTDHGYPVFGANGVVGMYSRFNHSTPQVTISCRGNCGTVNRTLGPAWITGNAMVVNLDGAEGVDKSYVYHALNYSDLSVLVTGSGIPQIVREALSKFVINIPADIQEQSAIGSFLSDLDDEITLVEVRLNKTRDLKQGMMQELLTGRTRLV